MKALQDILIDFSKENVVINKRSIDSIRFTVCELFSRYVIDGTLLENISHDYDPPWDCSGTLIKEKIGENCTFLYLLKKYGTLGEWTKNTYTGATIATGVSGCGFNHETYEDEVMQIIEDTLYNVISDILGSGWESDKLDMLSMGLEALIIEDINSISLKVAWDLTENIVRDKIRQEKEKHKIEQKIREEQNQLIDEIRMKYFSEYIGCRIESYNKKDLIEKINKIYPCLTTEELNAIKTEGTKLNLSGKVSNIVRNLTVNELKNRK
jgi:hypothetical protein